MAPEQVSTRSGNRIRTWGCRSSQRQGDRRGHGAELQAYAFNENDVRLLNAGLQHGRRHPERAALRSRAGARRRAGDHQQCSAGPGIQTGFAGHCRSGRRQTARDFQVPTSSASACTTRQADQFHYLYEFEHGQRLTDLPRKPRPCFVSSSLIICPSIRQHRRDLRASSDIQTVAGTEQSKALAAVPIIAGEQSDRRYLGSRVSSARMLL